MDHMVWLPARHFSGIGVPMSSSRVPCPSPVTLAQQKGLDAIILRQFVPSNAAAALVHASVKVDPSFALPLPKKKV